jgi:hypothetical protein
MGFVDKLKAGAEQAKDLAGQAAAKAKEEAKELALKRELGQEEGELGRKTFDLVESGALSHPDLAETVERIRSLKEELAALDREESDEEAAQSSAGAADEPPRSNVPPAMPS